MGITAMALALMVLALVAGLQWSLLFRFEDFYPFEDDDLSHARRVRLVFCTLTGLAATGILVFLLLVFRQLVTS